MGYWLLVVGCWLLVVGCWLLVVVSCWCCHPRAFRPMSSGRRKKAIRASLRVKRRKRVEDRLDSTFLDAEPNYVNFQDIIVQHGLLA
ncbi:hypothetical protein [Microcoleus sp. B4-D4]|uniref:hypothetical protein n=1 Tax=Microcoleus sp. B4-D4 TaxID=2818667 RepID=UPI003FA5951B